MRRAQRFFHLPLRPFRLGQAAKHRAHRGRICRYFGAGGKRLKPILQTGRLKRFRRPDILLFLLFFNTSTIGPQAVIVYMAVPAPPSYTNLPIQKQAAKAVNRRQYGYGKAAGLFFEPGILVEMKTSKNTQICKTAQSVYVLINCIKVPKLIQFNIK